MSLRDSEAPLSPMPSPPKPPCPWPEMLVDWTRLALALGRVAGHPILLGATPKDIGDLAMDTWRWMWSLPPCSELRKAAFSLGAAALWIERWRFAITHLGYDDPAAVKAWRAIDDAAKIGQRAEQLIRLAAWHLNDAHDEAHARTFAPTIPPHERIYERDRDGTRVHGEACARDDAPRIILTDHAGWRKLDPQRVWNAERMFTELAVASLPDGPWTMTSGDVDRFLDLIEENEP